MIKDNRPIENQETVGKQFEFENTYYYNPINIGFLKVFQIGELSSEPGFEVVEHVQICHEISYVVSGEGTFFDNGKARVLKQGDIHLVPFGKTHRILANKGANLRFAYIGFNFIESNRDEHLSDLSEFYANPPKAVVSDSGEARILIYMLINELYSKSIYNSLMIEAYLNQILVHIYRMFHSIKMKMFIPDINKKLTGSTAYSIIRYIDKNIFSIKSVKSISDALGYSNSYISHVFKEKVGMTIQDYISHKKIENSLELLRYKKISVTQISETLNYESVQAFSKVFKRVMDCSPSEYQRKSDK